MSYRPSKRRRHHIPGSDINIVPLMNVFVIIIPFLLLTAVFAKTAIIDILLPQETQGAAARPPEKATFFSVSVTERGFGLSGIGGGRLIPRKDGALDFDALAGVLVEIKERHPDHQDVVILYDRSAPYELVIQVMDATRETSRVVDGETLKIELFPVVSLGENR